MLRSSTMLLLLAGTFVHAQVPAIDSTFGFWRSTEFNGDPALATSEGEGVEIFFAADGQFELRYQYRIHGATPGSDTDFVYWKDGAYTFEPMEPNSGVHLLKADHAREGIYNHLEEENHIDAKEYLFYYEIELERGIEFSFHINAYREHMRSYPFEYVGSAPDWTLLRGPVSAESAVSIHPLHAPPKNAGPLSAFGIDGKRIVNPALNRKSSVRAIR